MQTGSTACMPCAHNTIQQCKHLLTDVYLVLSCGFKERAKPPHSDSKQYVANSPHLHPQEVD